MRSIKLPTKRTRAAGHDHLDEVTLATCEAHYDHLLAQGRAAGPPAAGTAAVARIRGYLSTIRKQGLPVLAAIESIFAGSPLIPNLAD